MGARGVPIRPPLEADGLGGQTPVFHAVNSIFNYCRPLMMEILVDAGADLDIRVRSPLLSGRIDELGDRRSRRHSNFLRGR